VKRKKNKDGLSCMSIVFNIPIIQRRRVEQKRDSVCYKIIPSKDVRTLWSLQRSGAGNPKAHPIQCIETGEVFSHIKEALLKYGQISISRVIRESRTAEGYYWKRITKEEYESILS
jgi:hypothetical protein